MSCTGIHPVQVMRSGTVGREHEGRMRVPDGTESMHMARNVAEGMWEMLASAGVRRCYFTLSLAKQVVSGNMDGVIETAERNVRLL
jgi:hypothetical protein